MEELVADLVLDVGDHLEELGVVYLRVAHDVTERVSQGCLELQQRFEGHLVDMFETVSVEVREVLCLKFPDELFIGILQEHLPYGPTGIDIENLLVQLLLDQFLSLFLIDNSLLNKTVDDECLLLSLGDLDIQQGVDLVDMVIHGLLVVQRMLMQVELVFFYELFWTFEFAAEEVGEQAWVGHDLMVFDVGVD